MTELVFATQNPNKITEVQCVAPSYKIVSLSDLGYTNDLVEDFNTLEENAKQKAEFVFNLYNKPCFAEDAGLEIDLLDGEPGVKSARYAGEGKLSKDNIALVLERLIGSSDRSAKFRAVIAYHDGEQIHLFEGRCYGKISNEPRGEKGFGYDPIFIPDGHEQTFAEMEPDEKQRISHRTIATKAFISHLER